MVMKIQVLVAFWIVTLCSDVVGCQWCEGPSSRQRPPKWWYPVTSLHSVTTQKTMTPTGAISITVEQLSKPRLSQSVSQSVKKPLLHTLLIPEYLHLKRWKFWAIIILDVMTWMV